MEGDRPQVLVIIDQPAAAEACRNILAGQGLEVAGADDGASALALFRDARPDVVVIDIGLSDPPGPTLLGQMVRIDDSVPQVVLTAQATLEAAVSAIKLGAFDFLPMPFSPDELSKAVRRAMERRHHNLEAQQLKDEKEALERNFITFVTHQLRSPLVASAQFFEVLVSGAAGELAPRQRDIIDKIYNRIQEQLDLINNWLDLSRVKTGLIVERLAPLELGPFLEKLFESHQHIAEAAGVELEYRPLKEKCLVRADGESLHQALANLLTNAIKYSGLEDRPPKVVLRTSQANTQAIIAVEDNGQGIPKEFIPFLFDEFSRGKHKGKKLIGTGLGLALANRIVADHGGTIEVKTAWGKGATFEVMLPCLTMAEKKAAAQKENGDPTCRTSPEL